MLALAILSAALVMLISRTTSNIHETNLAAMRGVAVELARGKMYDVEAQLLEDGFQELDQSSDGDFSDEGYRNISWEAVVEKVELPNLTSLEGLQGDGDGGGDGGGDGRGGDGGGPLGGILSMFGGFGGGGDSGDAGDGSAGAAFLTSQYEILRQVLEVSIRKVTLTLKWKISGEEQELVVACYFTNPGAMRQVLPGAGGAGGIPTSGQSGSSSSSRGSSSGGSSSSSGGDRK